MSLVRKLLARLYEKHRCKNTTIEIATLKAPGYRSMIRVRVVDKCHELPLGEALFFPERMEEFCRTAQAAADQIRKEEAL